MKPQEATRRPRDTPTGRLASDALPRPRHKPPVHPTSSSRPGEWMPEPSGSTPTTAPRRAGQFSCQDPFPVGRHSPALRLIEPPRGTHRHEPSARPRCDDALRGRRAGGAATPGPFLPAVSSGPATSLARSSSSARSDASLLSDAARGLRFATAAYSSGFHSRQLSGARGLNIKPQPAPHV